MDVQFQIRQNAMEMQTYMKDLFDWETSIKKKERAMTAAGAQASAGPAPRGRASGAVAPAPSSLMSPALGPKGPASAPGPRPSPASGSQSDAAGDVPAKKSAAAHTYSSYHKWDKFDLDAALASDDEADAKPSTSASHSQPAASHSQPAAAATVKAVSSTANAPTNSSNNTSSSASGKAEPGAALAAAAPAPHAGIQITARDPDGTTGLQEDLLRPVSTTRLARDSGSAAADEAAPVPSQLAAAALPPIRNNQPTTPDAWRARGNDLFKAGEYDSAYECYSRSVELQPTCLGHANRAMALLKLGRWQDAAADCTAAITLDPSYVKAYQRLAVAHRQLGAVEEAARDWEQALRLEPENRATAADRDASLGQLMAEQKLQPPSRRIAVQVSWPVQAAQAASGAAAPGRGEEGAPGGGGRREAAAAEAAQRAGPAEAEAESAGLGSGLGVSAAGVAGLGPRAAVSGVRPEPADAAGGGAAASPPQPPPLAAAANARPDVSSTQADARAQPSTAAAAAAPCPSRAAAPAATAAAAGAAGAAAAAARGVPRTSVEFEAAWRGLGGDRGRRAAYLAAIPPASLPSVFKNSLTAPVLASIVSCLLEGMAAAPAAAVAAATATAVAGDGGGEATVAPPPAVVGPVQGLALLEALTRVARFDLMAMSIPSRERSELRAVWEEVEGALQRGATAAPGAVEPVGHEQDAAAVAQGLAALRPKYRL